MDSSDVSDSTECPELEDMLGIEPLEIHLSFELNKQISCSIEVSNDMDDYFAFRISTTSLHPYYINTNKGILPPRSKCGITITLEALPHNQWRDEFSVQSTRVDGSLTDADITGDLFSEQPGKYPQLDLELTLSCISEVLEASPHIIYLFIQISIFPNSGEVRVSRLPREVRLTGGPRGGLGRLADPVVVAACWASEDGGRARAVAGWSTATRSAGEATTPVVAGRAGGRPS
nr:unnamed protein product [Digitaria exilis]